MGCLLYRLFVYSFISVTVCMYGFSYVCVVILYLHVHVCLVFVCSGMKEWLQSEHRSLNE